MLVGRRLSVANRTRKHRVVARIRMAIAAHFGVPVVLREPCVIERCPRPCCRGVTRCARRWESRCGVVRIRRVLIVGLMAPVAVRRKSRVVVVDMAIHAVPRRNRVRSRQRKCRGVVIERAVRPGDGVVAHLTCRRETQLCVVHRRSRCVVVALVT